MTVPEGTYQMITRTDTNGQKINEFIGWVEDRTPTNANPCVEQHSFMQDFNRPGRRAVAFNRTSVEPIQQYHYQKQGWAA
jgi:hypothetical protein